MKHAEKNEIDLLLRSLAKREAAARPENVEHLDADELNTYAEDAVPAAARARYTAHLADCSVCRQIVTQLTLASGIATRTEAVAEKGSSFWQRFATLFSPPVMKYAMPALVLVSVITIGVIVFRRQDDSTFLARVQSPANQADQSPTSADATQSTKENLAVAQATPSEQKTLPSEGFIKTPESQQQAKSDAQSREEADKNIATTKDQVAARRDSPYAPEPPAPTTTAAPPPAQSKPSDSAGAKQEQNEREKGERDNKSETVIVTDAARGRADDDRSRVRSAKRAESRRPEGAASDPPEAFAKEKKGASESRSVGGRLFRRESNVWIDSAYDSSRSVTNIRRGSEQYRALVADEPTLKTIADELGGVVIVVWKGRAYRFQ